VEKENPLARVSSTFLGLIQALALSLRSPFSAQVMPSVY